MIKIIDVLKNVKFPTLCEQRKPPIQIEPELEDDFKSNQKDAPSFKSGVEILANNQAIEERDDVKTVQETKEPVKVE